MKRFFPSVSLVILVAVFALMAGAASAQDRDDRNRERDDHRRWNRTTTVVCESRDGRRHRCATDTLGQITIGRQLSRHSNCVQDRTWGYDNRGIWVDRGCRAEFVIAENRGTYRGQGQAMRPLLCESDGEQRTYCRADTRFGVQLTRQISRNSCVLNRTWGSDQNGVWVSNGCRAEFTMTAREGGR